MAKVDADRGDAGVTAFSLGAYFKAAGDPKIWLFAMLFFGTTTITYALAYFMPVILKVGFGFDTAKAQCLTAPPYAFAGIVMYATGVIGDKYHIRGPIIIFNMTLCLIGLPIVGWHSNNSVRFFGIFLITAGANSNIPAVMTYQANNIRGQWKRAFCSASLVGFGGIGGIAGALVFRTQDRPHYLPGMWACIACALMNIIIVCLLTWKFRGDNAKAERGEIEIEGSEVSLAPTKETVAKLTIRRRKDLGTHISNLMMSSVKPGISFGQLERWVVVKFCDVVQHGN